ncbi:MAG TPA: hypothetical protein VGM54_03840 [Chthoniobacter sp.]
MPREDLPFCRCRWLERAAHDPKCPIEFDAEMNEYHLVHSTGGGYSLIYHCPFCAGRAPKSLRSKMFATISSEESARLHRLTKDLKTENEVRALLGEPTHVFDPGLAREEPEKNGKPGRVMMWKSLRYESHSETAAIDVRVNRHGEVSISFQGKYIGKPKKKKS